MALLQRLGGRQRMVKCYSLSAVHPLECTRKITWTLFKVSSFQECICGLFFYCNVSHFAFAYLLRRVPWKMKTLLMFGWIQRDQSEISPDRNSFLVRRYLKDGILGLLLDPQKLGNLAIYLWRCVFFFWSCASWESWSLATCAIPFTADVWHQIYQCSHTIRPTC